MAFTNPWHLSSTAALQAPISSLQNYLFKCFLTFHLEILRATLSALGIKLGRGRWTSQETSFETTLREFLITFLVTGVNSLGQAASRCCSLQTVGHTDPWTVVKHTSPPHAQAAPYFVRREQPTLDRKLFLTEWTPPGFPVDIFDWKDYAEGSKLPHPEHSFHWSRESQCPSLPDFWRPAHSV